MDVSKSHCGNSLFRVNNLCYVDKLMHSAKKMAYRKLSNEFASVVL